MILTKLTRQRLEARLAQAERAYRRVNEAMDAQLERAQDLEVQRAMTLYRAGKTKLYDLDESIREVRRLAR